MSADSIKALFKQVGEPEIIPFLEGRGKYTLMEVEDLLYSLISALAHPSSAYRARLRAGIMNDIWDLVYGFDQGAYMKWLILERIEHRVRARCLQDLNQELRVLANLWDRSGSGKDLDMECESLEDWDWRFLKEICLHPVPSPEAVQNTAGRAIYYASNGDMSGTVSAREAAEYFGWEIQ